MKGTGIAAGLVLPGLVWFSFAFESYGRAKPGMSLVQVVAGLAFAGCGTMEWIKHSRSGSN